MKFGRIFAVGAVLATVAIPAGAQGRTGPVSNTVRLLGSPEVRKELKLTPTQSEKIGKLQSGMKARLIETLRGLKTVPPVERTKKFASFRDGVDRQVVEILDPAQRKRLRELELQKEGARALTQPSFAAELRLTQEQVGKIHAASAAESKAIRETLKAAAKKEPTSASDRDKLQAEVAERRKQTDQELLKILTSDQRTRLKILQGAPFNFPEPKLPVGSPSGLTTKPAPKPATPPKKK